MLLVDDEYGILEVVAELLRAEGYHVRTAGDGREALQALAAEIPDVAVIDLMMPGMNGLALIEAMRGDPRLSRVPVIMITAAPRAVPPAVLAHVQLLAKPFEVDVLLAALDATLRRSSNDL